MESYGPPPGCGPVFTFCPMCATELVWQDHDGLMLKGCPACDFVNWDNPKPVAVLVIPKRNGLVLIKRRLDPGKGKWALPGGFVNQRETPTIAGVREAFEETGLRVRIQQALTVELSLRNHLVHFLLCEPAAGQERAGDDAEDIGVFKEDEVPADIAFDSHRRQISEHFARQRAETPRARPCWKCKVQIRVPKCPYCEALNY